VLGTAGPGGNNRPVTKLDLTAFNFRRVRPTGVGMKSLGALSLALGMTGLALGITAVVAELTWLGLIAGIAALVAGAVAFVLTSKADEQRQRHADLRARLHELEHAAAQQIQARMSAETDALVADQRAQKAELGSSLLADRLKSIRIRTAGAMQELTDPLTGLYGEEYFTATVDSRVASARRHLRPVSVVLIEAVTGVGQATLAPADPVAIANSLIETVREADTACRLVDGRFALILEDTPENGAIWTVERFRRQVVNEVDGITVWAGVACYPAHAFDADNVVRLSEEALISARDWGRDRIEVADSP